MLIICHMPAWARLQPWVDGLALQREHGERTLVHAPQRLLAREALQRFDAERELAQRQRPLCPEPARAEALDVRRRGVLRTVNDAQVLAPPAFDGGLHEPARAAHDELQAR